MPSPAAAGPHNGNPKPQAPNPKENPRVSIPKVADAVRWSLDILRLCLGFGFWDLELPLRGPSSGSRRTQDDTRKKKRVLRADAHRHQHIQKRRLNFEYARTHLIDQIEKDFVFSQRSER